MILDLLQELAAAVVIAFCVLAVLLPILAARLVHKQHREYLPPQKTKGTIN